MRISGKVPFRAAARVAALALLANPAQAYTQAYCSTDNTASDQNAFVDIYNTYQACTDHCTSGNYAFAILQWQSCWCSNYIPADQQDSGNCDESCPAWKADMCGNQATGFYAYVDVGDNQPSGTAGGGSSSNTPNTASSSSTPSTASPTSTPPVSISPNASSQDVPGTGTFMSSIATTFVPVVPSTSPSGITLAPSPTFDPLLRSSLTPAFLQSTSQPVQPTTHSSSTVAPSTTSSTSSPPTSSTNGPATTSAPSSSSAWTSLRVVTESGAVVTQTITSAPIAQAASKNGVSGGAVAGIVIGVVLGLALLAFGAFFLWRRSRENDGSEKKGFKRQTSVLSRAGFLGRGRRPSVSEGGDRATANSSIRHSALFAAGGTTEEGGTSSPRGSGNDGDSGRRHSRPLVYDQRLNPSALFANAEANGSRVSIQDTQDYSRPLGVMNPDPRASFESRISRV